MKPSEFSQERIVELLQEYYQDWWENSGLISIYLIGSLTTGEYSINESECPSDIDLLAITDKIYQTGKTQEFRNEINYIWKQKKQNPIKKIGIKVICYNELIEFQMRMISWGYDLNFSKNIFGLDSMPKFERQYKVPIITLIDNLIERVWYDIYCIEKSVPYTTPEYVCAKSILYGINFVLIANSIFCDSYSERIESFSISGFGCKFGVDALNLQECLKIKTGEKSLLKFQELDRIRDSFFDQIWEFLLSKIDFDSQYLFNTGYWRIDENFLCIQHLECLYENFQQYGFTKNVPIFYRHLIYKFSSSLNKKRNLQSNKWDEELIISVWNNFFSPQSKGKLNSLENIKSKSITEIVAEIEAFRLDSINKSPIIYS